MSKELSREQMLAHARELVEKLEQGDDAQAESILTLLTMQRETALFNEIGRFTRELHDALQRFSVDTRLVHITEREIPDAKERLNHVIATTEQAAHQTLQAIEDCAPLADKLGESLTVLAGSGVDDRATVVAEGQAHLQSIRAHMNEILMSQEFQDVTGQILQKVIQLVQRLEDNLVNLLAMSGQKLKREAPAERVADDAEDLRKGSGPAVPGKSDDTVQSQDDVDDLLSSLGF